MKISVFTPTNNTRYLDEAYNSLRAQTYRGAWEWVVVPNGGAVWTSEDTRVRVIPCESTGSVGAVKLFACQQAKGDILVEFDHDDILTPTALVQVAEAFKDSSIGMVYSNFAEFNEPDWSPNVYNECFGWRYREREFYGHKVQEAIGFPVGPLSLSHINFAPNHIRAWRTKDYWRIGGHDPKLSVADDHDITLRFYLESKLAHIDDCLYLYRNHPGNTWRTLGADLHVVAWQVADRYRPQLVKRWCELEGLPMLDLGGGFGKPEGYLSVDLHDADVMADLRNGLPFADNSVGVVRAHDLLEHLPDKIQTMNEIYRVLVPGGWLLSLTPSTDGRGAFQDPTHVSYWNSNSFWYYTQAAYAKYAPAIKCRFQTRRLINTFTFDWQRTHNIPYVQADLVALKDGMESDSWGGRNLMPIPITGTFTPSGGADAWDLVIWHDVGNHKWDATEAPDANNDVDEGYVVGSLWCDVTNDKVYICIDNTADNAVWIEQGDGPQGVQGASVQGPQGNQGAGVQGNQGASVTGPQGNQGASVTGPQGNQGASVTGPQGNQGASVTGPQGNQGTSVTGPQGNQGSQGSGSQGNQGSQGAGSQGNQGPQGAQGGSGSGGSALFATALIPGVLTTGGKIPNVPAFYAGTATELYIRVITGPTGADLKITIYQLNQAGGAVANQQIVLAHSGNYYKSQAVNWTVTKDDYFNVNIDQIGSTVAGATLVWQIRP